MYPQFDPNTQQYAVGCGPLSQIMLTAIAQHPGTVIFINSGAPALGRVEQILTDLSGDADIIVDLSNKGGSTRYVVHCLPEDFPEISIVKKEDGVTEGLILAAPKFRQDGERKSFLMILDNNGVPLFHRKVDGSVNDFKRRLDGGYSYLLRQAANEFGLADNVVVLLDDALTEVMQLKTVGLNHTDSHDFLITEEENRLFISYNSTIRDMTMFGLTDQETVGDSMIQEVTPAGKVVFEWNSWDHIDVADCSASGYPRFPADYAHLNSIQLTQEGDIVGSFRGCGQILKIDRPTGDIIWQLGGTANDFLIVGDRFEEFCGQHTAMELEDDRVLMFDNGNYCLGQRENVYGQFTRILEYRLDTQAGQANFIRDYSLNGTFQEFTRSQGAVQELENGNWLISWGNGPDMSITEVDSSGQVLFAMKILIDGSIAVTYRAFRYPDLILP